MGNKCIFLPFFPSLFFPSPVLQQPVFFINMMMGLPYVYLFQAFSSHPSYFFLSFDIQNWILKSLGFFFFFKLILKVSS